MGILSKSTIETWILPHLPVGKRGFETTVPLRRNSFSHLIPSKNRVSVARITNSGVIQFYNTLME